MRKCTGKQTLYPKNVIELHNSQAQQCTRCGQPAHAKKVTCPAKDQVCHRCNKKGHFKKMCRTKHFIRDIEQVEEQDKFLGEIHVNSAIDTIPYDMGLEARIRM